MFDLGKHEGQWKIEEIKMSDSTPSVIKPEDVKPYPNAGAPLILPKCMHISGAGGCGKSEYIMNLAKSHKKIMFICPTTSAVKNLLDRAKSLNISIE